MNPAGTRSTRAARRRSTAVAATAAAVVLCLSACAANADATGDGPSSATSTAGASSQALPPADGTPAPSASPSGTIPAPSDASSGGVGAGGLAALRAEADLAPCPAEDPAARPRTDGLPDISLECLGQPDVEVNLSKVRGTPMVVSIWGSWCPPCRAEVPAFESVWQQAGGEVQFLGIDLQDDPARALAFAADVGMTYPSVSDPKAVTRPQLFFAGPPVTYFVNAQGRMTGRVDGQISTPDDLRRYMKQYLDISLPRASA